MTRHKCLTALAVVLLLAACSRPVQQNETPVGSSDTIAVELPAGPSLSATGAIYALIWCCATRSRHA